MINFENTEMVGLAKIDGASGLEFMKNWTSGLEEIALKISQGIATLVLNMELINAITEKKADSFSGLRIYRIRS